MTDKQAIFDKVARHLLTQREKAQEYSVISGSSCRYRTEDGQKCAIGCLIPDELYDSVMEGVAADNVEFVLKPLMEAGVISKEDFAEAEHKAAYGRVSPLRFFLSRLQGIHDDLSVPEWPDGLYKFAKEWDLDYSVLAEFGWTE